MILVFLPAKKTERERGSPVEISQSVIVQFIPPKKPQRKNMVQRSLAEFLE